MGEVKKPRRVNYWIQGAISIAIVAALSTIYFFTHEEQMVRPRVVYAKTVMHLIRKLMWEKAIANPRYILTQELPDVVQGEVDPGEVPEEGYFATLDPFDTKNRKGERKLKTRAYINACGTFTFRGNKIKYLRLNDEKGLMYSIGPDRKDNLRKASQAELTRIIEESDRWSEAELRYLYDPTNGTISYGDIFTVIDLRESRTKGN